MKKTFLTIMLALMGLTSWAQQEKGTWFAQMKVGMNVSGFTSYRIENQTYSYDTSAYPRIAMHFGLEVERQLTDRWGLVAGAQYSMQGDKESTKMMGDKFEITNKVDYINIPLLAKFYVVKGLSLKAGLQPAFCVRKVYDSGTTTRKLSEIGVPIRNFDLAVPLGIAYEFDNHSSTGLSIEARWNMGLLKVAEDVEGDAIHNMVFQLSLGYRFRL